jgi:4-hydroxy-3-polyprenylbenzoate decarboxylase
MAALPIREPSRALAPAARAIPAPDETAHLRPDEGRATPLHMPPSSFPPYDSLRDFIDDLERRGLLARVRASVSPNLEMTEIQTRVLAEGGPALLFETVAEPGLRAYGIPALANLFGTVERVALGLGRRPEELRALGQMLASLESPSVPSSLKDAFALWSTVKTALVRKPRTVDAAPCQEVIAEGDDADLGSLPIQTCWPGEPAPLITWPLVVTRAPDDSKCARPNLGIYRMQVTGPRATVMRWLAARGGAKHFEAWRATGAREMPAAAVIGCDPATLIAAVTPVPEHLPEYEFAGLLRGRGIDVVPARTVPLLVPSAAEIVIEGYVSMDDTAPEGPYGDHTGYYNSVERFPTFRVTAITSRSQPIYLTTYTGRPPDEPSVLAQALNDVFLPILQRKLPEIADFYLPPEACSYRIAVVSIRKTRAGHARDVMKAVWSTLHQFSMTKIVIVVDDDIDARNWADVMWAVSTRMDPSRDLLVIENSPIDYLDFASPVSGAGGKLGIDATNKIGAETSRIWGTPIRMSDEVIDGVTRRWRELGLAGSGRPIWHPASRPRR